MIKKIIWFAIAIIVILLLWTFFRGGDDSGVGDDGTTGGEESGALGAVEQAVDNSILDEGDDVELGELI